MENKNIIDVFKSFNQHTDDYLGAMFINMFSIFPRCYRFFFNGLNDNKLEYIDYVEDFNTYNKNIKKRIDTRKLIKNAIDKKDELGLTVFCYSQYEYLIIGNNTHHFLMSICLSDATDIYNNYEEIFCSNTDIEYIYDNIIKYLIEPYTKEEKVEFGIAASDVTNNLYVTWYDYSFKEVDINKNYNDDFIPFYDKMCNLINNEENADLFLLYGEPGTGKSTIIKNLINKFRDKEFVFLDSTLLINTSQQKLMSFFLDNKNTVFILEDCEKALISRDKDYNPAISVLLNITDGIIGDVLGIKLICTFNTDLRNIDKALLRKGRLSLKYEFKKLDKEKVRKILNDETINQDMTLAEIYNLDENDFSKNNTRKIGF